MSTTNAEIPYLPRLRSVEASNVITFAWFAFEMKVLTPFTTYWSPSRTAVVDILLGSDPAPGSVIAMQLRVRPAAMPGSQRCLIASEPWSTITCTPGPIAERTKGQNCGGMRASSS